MRFSLTQLLMLIALVGIGLAFWQADYGTERNFFVSDLDFSPDGRQLAVTVYDSGSSKQCRTIEVVELNGYHRQNVNREFLKKVVVSGLEDSVSFIEGGHSLMFLSFDGKSLYRLNMQSGTMSHVTSFDQIDMATTFSVSDNDRRIALGVGKTVVVVDDVTETVITQYEHELEYAEIGPSLSFVPGRDILLVGADRAYAHDLNTGNVLICPTPLQSQKCFVKASPDGSTIAAWSTGAFTDYLAVTKLDNGEMLCKIHGGVIDCAFTPDGKNIAVSRLVGVPSKDRPVIGGEQVDLWNVQDGLYLDSFGPGFDAELEEIVSAVAFSPDGKTLAAGDSRGMINFWDVESKRLYRTLDVRRAYLRHTWPIPAALLFLWLVTAILLYRRRKKRRIAMTTGMMSSTASLQTPLGQSSIAAKPDQPH